MLVNEISTKVKMWAIILTVETVGFLVHMDYNIFYNNESIIELSWNVRYHVLSVCFSCPDVCHEVSYLYRYLR